MYGHKEIKDKILKERTEIKGSECRIEINRSGK
jgi:hypothetical protein